MNLKFTYSISNSRHRGFGVLGCSRASRDSNILKIPKKKNKRAKKGDSDIDGELMSNASKGKKQGKNIFMNEVTGGQID